MLPSLNAYGAFSGTGHGGPLNPNCSQNEGPGYCSTTLPSGTPGVLKDTFNYSVARIPGRLHAQHQFAIARPRPISSALCSHFRQSQISYEQQKKNILFDVRNSKFALEQAQARVDAALKARDLAQKTFDIIKQEQVLGAKSSVDTLIAENALAQAESALDAAATNYEKKKVDIDRAIGETLERTGVSIDDAKTGVVTRAP